MYSQLEYNFQPLCSTTIEIKLHRKETIYEEEDRERKKLTEGRQFCFYCFSSSIQGFEQGCGSVVG
jgi:hypothetical protein